VPPLGRDPKPILRPMISRPSLLIFHRRLALVVAPLLLLQAMTGSVLLFRAEIARLIEPHAMARTGPGRDVPVSAMTARAEAALPGFRIARLHLPATPRDTAFAQLTDRQGALRYAAIDPGNGRLLAAGTIWRFPLEAALQLHYRLMDAKAGMAVILANALALIFLAATGTAFWWPGRKQAAKSLAIRAGAPPRARLRQWHRSTGVLLSFPVLFSATTGALLIVPDLAEPAGATPIATPAPGAAAIDRAVAHAAAAFPGERLRDIRFPQADRIDVNFFAPRQGPRAVDVASVSLSDGQLLKRIPATENPALWMTILPLHTGDRFGIGGRILLLIEALALIFLACSGPLMWWHARRPKRRKS